MKAIFVIIGLVFASNSMASYRSEEYCQEGRLIRCLIGSYVHECEDTGKSCAQQSAELFLTPSDEVKVDQSQALASPLPEIQCIDQSYRYILQDFKATEGRLGSLTFIDSFDRMNIRLFCGVSRQSERVEIACASSHLPDNSRTNVRVRIHRQADKTLPRVALIETQQRGDQPGTIDAIIPLVCKLQR